MAADALSTCPFCEQETGPGRCAHCGRDPTDRRRVCGDCKKMTPSAEPACCHCGKRFRSELAWKVPTIVVMFVAAIVVSIVLRITLD